MCYRLGCRIIGAVGSRLPRFSTIQVRPKDVLAWPWRAEREIEHRSAVGCAVVIIGGAYPRGGSHMFDRKRREFITLLGDAAIAGMLMTGAAHTIIGQVPWPNGATNPHWLRHSRRRGAAAHLPRLQQSGFSRRVRPPGGFSLVEASSTELELRNVVAKYGFERSHRFR
jgi:hypothetical protein